MLNNYILGIDLIGSPLIDLTDSIQELYFSVVLVA
jgi:hypothetical protein